LDGLDIFFPVYWFFVVDEEGKNAAIALEKGFHIHYEIFDDPETEDRFDGDGVCIQVFDQSFAGEKVSAINSHGIGSADSMGTRTAEREG